MEFYNYLKIHLESESELEQQSMTYEQYQLRTFIKISVLICCCYKLLHSLPQECIHRNLLGDKGRAIKSAFASQRISAPHIICRHGVASTVSHSESACITFCTTAPCPWVSMLKLNRLKQYRKNDITNKSTEKNVYSLRLHSQPCHWGL